MLNIIRQNPSAFIAAFVVHALLVIAMLFSVHWMPEPSAPAGVKVNVIQAVLINEARPEVDVRQDREDEARRKKLAQEVEAAKRKRIAEKKRLKELERKKDETQRQAQVLKKKQQQEEAKHLAKIKAEKTALEKKKKAEQQRLADAERQRKAKVEQQRKAAEVKKKADAERKRKAVETQRRAEEEQQRQQQFAEEQAILEAQHQRFIQSEMGRYITLIQQKVASKWVKPSGWGVGISCRVNVRVVPGAAGGQVMNVRVTQSCGNPLFDRSVETAVFNAEPLPLPSDPKAAEHFRNIDFNFNPGDF